MAQPFAEALTRVPMSRPLGDTFGRAHHYAREQAHRRVTLEHLLLSLCDDPDSGPVLQACQIDVARLATDASGYVGRIEDRFHSGEAAEPEADPDLLRILEYAAAAAHQSRRREINGAIVLAAIVGEGRSAAAQMLRAQGLTFEETIKALQRATAAARQQTIARTAEGPQPASAPSPQHQPQPQPQPQPASALGRPAQPRSISGSQTPTAEEILASVRERINSGRTQPPGSRQPNPAQPQPTQATEPAFADPFADRQSEIAAQRQPEFSPPPYRDSNPSPVDPPALPPSSKWPTQTAPEEARASPPPELPEFRREPPQLPARGPVSSPAAQSDDGLQPQGWVPPPQVPPPRVEGRRPVARPPTPLPPLMPPPPPQPTVSRAPIRPERQPPPWPEAHRESLPPQARPPGGPQAGDGQRPQAAPPGPPAPQGRSAGQVVPAGRAVDLGQLVENVPRFMRAGVPEIVEVRIARSDLQNIAVGMEGRGSPVRHDLIVTRAMSVKLRAPDGGFWIETASPETQWIESRPGLMTDDFATWRWTVLPERRGRSRLQLVAAARTVGADGLAAETALPDQVIEVRVAVNYRRLLAKWGGWAAAAVIGGALARFGESAIGAGLKLMGG